MRTTIVHRWRVVLAAVGIACVVPVPVPAASAAPQRRDAIDALVALESEVMALVELGAFPAPVLPKLDDVDREWRDAVDGYDRSDLLDWLHSSEADGVAELGRFGDAALSDDVRRALGALSAEDVRAVEAGQVIGIPMTVYEHALHDLEFRDGAPPAGAPSGQGGVPGTAVGQNGVPAGQDGAPAAQDGAPAAQGGVPAVGSGTQPPSTTAASVSDPVDTTAAGTADEPPGDEPGVPALPFAVAAVAVVAVGAAVARRRRGTGPDDAVAELLDAGRRLSSSVDGAEIAAILAQEGLALTRSDRVDVVLRDGAALIAVAAAGTDAAPLAVEHADRGVIGRVLGTGSFVRTVGDDPVLGQERFALLAVPLVRDGAVAGVVVARRRQNRPYGGTELEALSRLVPLAAASLVAAGRHDDVALLSLTDGLTELGNRRRLDRDLVEVLGAGSGSVGFVMVDIDHFKRFNDTNGHVAGDEVLRRVAAVLRANVRAQDVVYRYGGEEFCVLLPDATTAEAVEVSERLRRAVEAEDVPGAESQPDGRLTISVGTTVARRIDPTAIKERADLALYEAKHRGRNRVVLDEAAGD